MAPPVVAATSIASNSSTSLTALAGAAVTELPSVIVKDQQGAAMPGVPVTFTVASGGGTVTGSSVTTNASGVATVGRWTLGTVAGSNSLTASTTGLTPVTFIANGTTDTGVLLPTLGGEFASARAVNHGGVVVGSSEDDSGINFAVRWTRTASGSWSITQIALSGSRAEAINENGAAVGVHAGGAKLWPAAGGEIDLGPGEPSGINDAETVVGLRRDPFPSTRVYAVVWRKPSNGWNTNGENASQDLPPIPDGTGSTSASAINDAGVIVGRVGSTAVRWNPVGGQWTQPISLPSTDATGANAINDNPQADIAGYFGGPGSTFGIFWPQGSSGTSLEPFGGGGVFGMNNAQRVVGVRSRRGLRAFVWRPGLTSVQELGWPASGGYTDSFVGDINNASPAQAVGYVQGGPIGSRGIVWTIP